jgi:nitroreductase
MPWEFILVDDPKLIEKLSDAKMHGSQFLKNAPLAIVIIANEEITDVWVEDTSIAATIIQLQAETIGLGSCWVQIRNRLHTELVSSEEYIAKIFDFPKNIRIEAIIGIGYPDEKKEAYTKDDLIYGKVYKNKYDTYN